MDDLVRKLRRRPHDWKNPEQALLDNAADEIERLTTENAALKDHNGTIIKLGAENDRLRKEVEALRAALVEIKEYWNGSRNDSAMFDALNHIDEVAARALVEQ